jgi:hypothetical protein
MSKDSLKICLLFFFAAGMQISLHSQSGYADAVACVKSTCFNLCKAGHKVNVISDCITSYDKKKIDEMLHYYESKGSKIIHLNDLLCQ